MFQSAAASIVLLCQKASRNTLMFLIRPAFRRVGRRVKFHPLDQFSFHSITLGDDVYIGPGAYLSATESEIIIGSKVMLGPNVTILGGDHNTTQVGRYMYDVREKLPGNDLPVVIEDDVWVGAGAIILKGVTIHRGAIVGAGAIVTRDVPEYAIVVGAPAKVVRMRWSESELARHRSIIEGCGE